jgi:hypothetical protein
LGISVIAPAVGKSYSLTPTFFWRPDDATMDYTFKLASSADPDTPLFESKVIGSHFTYPASAPALEPGAMYVWTVQPAVDMLGQPVSGHILIVGGAERGAIAAALAALPSGADAGAAQARIFMEKRLWFDALAAYTNLIAESPKRAEFHAARAELYDQLANTADLADADAAAAAAQAKR